MKKTTKTKKPLYIVDLVGKIGGDVSDVKYSIICAKLNAGIKLTEEEDRFRATYVMKGIADIIFGDAPMSLRIGPTTFYSVRRIAIDDTKKKRPNIFKRFWNWLTGK